ncbi:MAG: ribonuclease Z [Bacteroidales bacterium]
MAFELTVLGSSSAIPTTSRFPTAQVLNVRERFFLLDCGEGTQIQLRRFSINMSRISHIFISHLHGDHVFGLFGLLSSYNLMGRKADMHIYAHRDFETTLEHFRKHFAMELSFDIVFHPFTAVKQMEIYSDRHLTVEIIPLRHSVPVVGFLFREKKMMLNIRKEAIEKYALGIKEIRNIKSGMDHLTADGRVVPNAELTLPPFKTRSYAFCTDTLCFSKLKAVLQDVDLLYFEATFSAKDKKLAKLTGHSTSEQAALLAKQSNVGKLLIGHFSTRYKSIAPLLKEARAVFPNTEAVSDGDKFSIDPVRVESGS